mgnify:CR=1 FL=1
MRKPTVIFSQVCDLLLKDDVALLDILAGSDKFLKDNFRGLEQFLNAYQPAFAIQCHDKNVANSFRHVTTWLSQSNLSRRSANLSINSSYSGRILNSFDYAVELNGQTGQYVSFEEALDMKLLLPYNIFK